MDLHKFTFPPDIEFKQYVWYNDRKWFIMSFYPTCVRSEDVSARKKSRSLFQAILVPQFCMLVLLVLVLIFSMPISTLGDKVTHNYQNVVALQTEHQGDYLASYLNTGRTEIAQFSANAVALVQDKLDAQHITLHQLEYSSSYYIPVLTELSESLVNVLSTCHANGAFILFNTADPATMTERPCLYLRSTAPAMQRSGSSVTALYAPESICRKLILPQDENWQALFRFEDAEQQAYFYEPFSSVYRNNDPLDAASYGCWTVNTFQADGSEQLSIVYSEPILLEDGTVIGVVGVEFFADHLAAFLPTGKILESNDSGYILAVSTSGSEENLTTVINGNDSFLQSGAGESFTLSPLHIGGYSLMNETREFYSEVSFLDISSANQRDLQWYMVGVVGMNEMFSFANEMTEVLILTILLTLLVGIVSVITVSLRLAKPISRLSSEVDAARKVKSSYFTATGIREIDQLSDDFRGLMQETADTASKFMNIMDMASVELAGYEWREGSDSVYVTKNFFPMLGMDHIDTETITVPEFTALLQEIRTNRGASITLDGSRLYRINPGGKVRYVRAESTQSGDRHIGLLEDVTRNAIERFRIEHERDHDMITGLYNRRAFYNRAKNLFGEHEDLQCAALLVLDVDSLKNINSRYGHDYGDRYLHSTAQCIQANTPSKSICARISGDEFYVFLHGYTDRRKLRSDINDLIQRISESALQLPGDETLNLSVTGGYALYPDDTDQFAELVKYADFAMYQAKLSRKGSLKQFNEEDYAKTENFNRGRDELKKLIEQENVSYHFQPIFSAATARPAAYEALMRVNTPSIKSPDMVVRLAAAEGSQYHIERITMFKASETYLNLLERKQVRDDAMLFINSQPDQCLTDEDANLFHERFSSLQDRIVLEITEDEYLGLEALEVKRNYPGFSGNFALDDYGSGYNGEKNLLLLQPQFVKVDVVFIRGIDSNPDRQQLVSSLVAYAHGRGMQVVAEGIETAEELQKSLELGVDLFQGYFLAKPAAIPAEIAPQAEEIILAYNREQKR